MQCDYKAMTYFGDRVCIDVKLSSFRGVKYEISYEMRDEKTGELRASATSAHCYLGKNGRPSNIKKELPELYAKMMEELQKVEKE